MRKTTKMRLQPLIAAVSTLATFLAAPPGVMAQGDVHCELADRGMVVSESAYASRVGREVMAQGGNAVDAAVATALALAVTWPEAGNIGGGGFMLVHPADGAEPVCIDYREAAPLSATVDTFTRGDSRHTRKIVGVPGTLRGLELAHKKFGVLPWKRLVVPAARLATEGFSVDAFLARSANKVLKATKSDPAFAELHRVYGKPDGSPWKTGDMMILPDLGETLTDIAEQGPDAFYTGPLAEKLLREMAKAGGLIRRADLESYRAKVRQPVVGAFNGYTVFGAPPPSSGGCVLVQALNLVEAVNLPKDKNDPLTLHFLAEISRRCYLDRARYLGDPDFVEIPDHLTTKAYARELAAGIDPLRATESASLAPDLLVADESEDTTHFSVVDVDGMAVSNTYTIESSWGSRVVVPGAGFLLNNEMGDFNWVEGETDRKGHIGTDANLIAPGKRMLSSQCPVIICKAGKPVLVTGSPGGRTIPNTVFNVVLNALHFDMPLPLAVQAKRFHHQWMPDVLYLEDVAGPPFQSARGLLEARGHTIKNRVSQGSAHSIGVDVVKKHLLGVADYRRGGRPAGLSSRSITRWDFGGSKGGGLVELPSSGRHKLAWSNEIAGSSLDGGDRYKIRRDAPQMPDRAYARLPDITERVAATIVFDGIQFAGPSKNEKLQFAFTQNDSEKPGIVAAMAISRNNQNQVVLFGEASGKGASRIDPVVLSPSPRVREPFAIRLTVEPNGNYCVGLFRPTATEYTSLGTGRTGHNRTIGFARLRAINDFSYSGEYVRIDSIELEASQAFLED